MYFYDTVMVSLSLYWVRVVAVMMPDAYYMIIMTKIFHCSTFVAL